MGHRQGARPADGAQQAASDSPSATYARAGQHAHCRRRCADPGPDADCARTGADLLAGHDGHAAGRGVGRRPGGRAVRREALRQGSARLAAPGPHAGRRRPVHRRDTGAQLAEGAQHPAAYLRTPHDADLPRRHARHRAAARHQVGAAERRRGDRRGARHDRAHLGHDRPVRLQLPFQFLLSQRQPSLCRIAGQSARGSDEDARPAARGHRPAQEPQEARPGCPLHERHRRPHHSRAPRGPGPNRRRGDQAKPDLLGYMLSGIDKQSGERLDDVNIRYQMNTFLIAGHETTSGMLSFAIYFLLNNPHVLQKAYAEVDRVLGRDINAKPTASQVNQLVYIGQVLKESLRLWPTAPAFGLYPYQNETIGGKYKLRKRTFITVLTAMLHRDKSVWGPQAEVFNPDNFAPERETEMPPHAFKPFGNGQRACIGRQFAMTEATLVLGLILQRFRLIDHTRYQLKIKESLTIKPEGLMMRVRLRPDVVRGSGVSVAPKPAARK